MSTRLGRPTNLQSSCAIRARDSLSPFAEAHKMKLEIDRVEEAFGGVSFDDAGPYEKSIGRAYAEVDPAHPLTPVL